MTITIGALTIGHRRRAATPDVTPLGTDAVARPSRRPTPTASPRTHLRATWLLVRLPDGSVRPEMTWAPRPS